MGGDIETSDREDDPDIDDENTKQKEGTRNLSIGCEEPIDNDEEINYTDDDNKIQKSAGDIETSDCEDDSDIDDDDDDEEEESDFLIEVYSSSSSRTTERTTSFNLEDTDTSDSSKETQGEQEGINSLNTENHEEEKEEKEKEFDFFFDTEKADETAATTNIDDTMVESESSLSKFLRTGMTPKYTTTNINTTTRRHSSLLISSPTPTVSTTIREPCTSSSVSSSFLDLPRTPITCSCPFNVSRNNIPQFRPLLMTEQQLDSVTESSEVELADEEMNCSLNDGTGTSNVSETETLSSKKKKNKSKTKKERTTTSSTRKEEKKN